MILHKIVDQNACHIHTHTLSLLACLAYLGVLDQVGPMFFQQIANTTRFSVTVKCVRVSCSVCVCIACTSGVTYQVYGERDEHTSEQTKHRSPTLEIRYCLRATQSHQWVTTLERGQACHLMTFWNSQPPWQHRVLRPAACM
jgi:hypothetical protein